MGCTDDVKEERHVHVAHLHMCTHTRANGLTYRRALACACIHTVYICVASADIIKLNVSKCIRKLIKHNVRPLNVNFYNKTSKTG